MEDPFHAIGAAGLALVVSSGIYWLYGLAALFPRMHDSDKAHMRYLMMVMVCLDVSVTGFICLGGWLLHRIEAPFWMYAAAGLLGGCMMMSIYVLHWRLRTVDRARKAGMFADRSLNGTMIDAISNAPAGALLWITFAA
jgi:hypothetical protein